ncbi:MULTISPECIES: nucleotide-binding protein [Rhodococcus]|uniref:nucleotide-binding protein n=1 Tax=Rhodococcus TaxID=1827 RepID=UPI00197D8117|nr:MULTISPECIES: ParA family protein [Rhodococcus]QSE86320.1 ParA family protein [Rhodococcus koreensis]UZG59977.1 ParA family protein [Rhodococcus opacus]
MHEFTVEIVSDRVARVAGTGDELVAPVGKSIQDSIYEYSQKVAVDAGAPVEVAVHRSGRCTQVTVAPDGTASRSAPTGPIPTSADRGEEPANADMIAEEPVSLTSDALGDTAHPAPDDAGQGSAPHPAHDARRQPVSVLAAPGIIPGATEPARTGIRGRLNAVLGLSLSPKPSSTEMRLRVAAATIAGPIPDFSTITVANTKGGVGKTPIAVGLAQTLATHRGGATVVCADLAESGGSLADRVSVPPPDEQNIFGLLAADQAATGHLRPSALGRHLTRQPSGEDIVAGHHDLTATQHVGLSGDDAAALASILAHHREILVADTGNNPLAGSWQWAVSEADALVVPVPLRRDAATTAHRMLLDLATTHPGRLDRTVVIITDGPGDTPMVESDTVDAFIALGVQVLRMPYEPLFAGGERIVPHHLRRTTAGSLTVITATVVDLITKTG